jgi:hypothetical protein
MRCARLGMENAGASATTKAHERLSHCERKILAFAQERRRVRIQIRLTVLARHWRAAKRSLLHARMPTRQYAHFGTPFLWMGRQV